MGTRGLSSVSKEDQDAGYQCLVGRSFSVDEEIYVVGMLMSGDEQTLVKAHLEQDRKETVLFRVADVLDRLLVDEEIELFHPGYIGR